MNAVAFLAINISGIAAMQESVGQLLALAIAVGVLVLVLDHYFPGKKR